MAAELPPDALDALKWVGFLLFVQSYKCLFASFFVANPPAVLCCFLSRGSGDWGLIRWGPSRPSGLHAQPVK